MAIVVTLVEIPIYIYIVDIESRYRTSFLRYQSHSKVVPATYEAIKVS